MDFPRKLDASKMLEFPMEWPDLHQIWVHPDLVWWKIFTTLYCKDDINFVARQSGSLLRNRSQFPRIQLYAPSWARNLLRLSFRYQQLHTLDNKLDNLNTLGVKRPSCPHSMFWRY
jgi:hypothetical protein